MNWAELVTRADIASILPELFLAAGGVIVLLLDTFAPAARRLAMPLAVATVLGAAHELATTAPMGPSFGGLIESSPTTVAIGLVVLASTLLAILASEGFLGRLGLSRGEYYALFLWCVAGVLFTARATELLTLFLALEFFSVCLYSLAGYPRRLAIATEAALKYFLMGAFVSAFILLGIALVYGATGSTEISTAMAAAAGAEALPALGLLLIALGFAFKMSLVPFHAWSPDAYQGAPSPFVAFLSVAPKAAAALVLVRLFALGANTTPGGFGGDWSGLAVALAALSIVVGNLLALAQRDIKRMLAYSGIAHMGLLMIPLATLDEAVMAPVFVYLAAYALMNGGAFAAISILYPRPGEQHLITELAGQGYRRPLVGACLAVCMLSLGGIPPTLGFLAKYQVFVHAIQHDRLGLALLGIAGSIVGVYYYLRVIYSLYMRQPADDSIQPIPDLGARTAAVIATLATLWFGLFPGGLLDRAGDLLR